MSSKNFIVDVETLDVESTAVILSIAIIQFELDEKPDWNKFLNRSLFIKLNAEKQIRELKRTADKGTMEWWSKQCDLVKNRSFIPGIYDLDVDLALDYLRGYAHLSEDTQKNRDVNFWARGVLDQVTLDSLTKAAKENILVPYNNWYDIRTAVDLTCEDSNHGYCKVPGFDSGVVMKHDPVHDCAYDLMMLLSNNLTKNNDNEEE